MVLGSQKRLELAKLVELAVAELRFALVVAIGFVLVQQLAGQPFELPTEHHEKFFEPITNR